MLFPPLEQNGSGQRNASIAFRAHAPRMLRRSCAGISWKKSKYVLPEARFWEVMIDTLRDVNWRLALQFSLKGVIPVAR